MSAEREHRICPGLHLAELSVLVVAASLLNVFNITNPLDEDGVPITPETAEHTGGVIRYVLRFVVSPPSKSSRSLFAQSPRSFHMHNRTTLRQNEGPSPRAAGAQVDLSRTLWQHLTTQVLLRYCFLTPRRVRVFRPHDLSMNLLYCLVVHYNILFFNPLLDSIIAVFRRYPLSIFIPQFTLLESGMNQCYP